MDKTHVKIQTVGVLLDILFPLQTGHVSQQLAVHHPLHNPRIYEAVAEIRD